MTAKNDPMLCTMKKVLLSTAKAKLESQLVIYSDSGLRCGLRHTAVNT
jgi:hypothetical protein